MARLGEPRLLFIVGPTASGKSDLAVEIAEKSKPAEIINCDSIQFFAGVDIGAAKPEPELLARVPHHLIGHVALGGSFTAGDFCREALAVIEERAQHGVSRFLPVGGSGFYVQALEKGMYEVPEIPEQVRTEIEAQAEDPLRVEELHRELTKRDPEAALRISVRDRYRIVRALEILRAHPTGGTLSDIKKRFAESAPQRPFSSRKIGLALEKEALRKRVRERAERMLKSGLIEEVEALRAKGLSHWSPLNSVGYREVQAMLDGHVLPADLADAIVTSTMQLVKKQMTWFKRDASIQWFDAEKALKKAVEAGQSALKS